MMKRLCVVLTWLYVVVIMVGNNGVMSSSPLCTVCVDVLDILADSVRTNSSVELIEDIAYGVCVAKKIRGGEPSLCRGIVKEFGPEIVYIYSQKYLILGGRAICDALHFCDDDAGEHRHHLPPAQLTNVTRATLRAPGARSKRHQFDRSGADKEVGTFIQLSDVHYDSLYNEGSLSLCDYPICCRNAYGIGTNSSNTAGKYGDYNCDLPETTLQSLIRTLKTFDPDFVIMTGDDPPHDVWKQSRDYNLMAAYNVSVALKEAFKVPVFPALGNHESFPVNQFRGPPYDSWLYDALSVYWSDWLHADTLKQFQYAGYYTQLISPGHRIIALNTMYCLGGNFWLMLNGNNMDRGGQLNWLNKTLEAATMAGEAVYMIGHVPFGLCNDGAYDEKIRQMVEQHQHTVVGQFYGHTHHDLFEVVRDSADKVPINTMFISPSVTTAFDLNPTFRVYYYNRTDKQVLDYDQYFMNLTEANLSPHEEPVWRISYSARAEYQMNGLRPGDYQDLIQRMTTNDATFNKFLRHYYNDHVFDYDCDAGCRHDLLCRVTSSTRTLYEACVANLDVLLKAEKRLQKNCGGL